MLSADAHFMIGNGHVRQGKPCQDYAIANFTGKTALAVVSDGCSSGGKTDVGSRLVALTTAKAIEEQLQSCPDVSNVNPAELLVGRDTLLAGLRDQLNLTSNDMLATCLHACVDENGGYVHVHGDGVVGFRYADGRVIIHTFDWAQNMPFYPAYTGSRRRDFLTAQQEHEKPFSHKVLDIQPDDVSVVSDAAYTAVKGTKGITIPVHLTHKTYGNLTHVILLSDGAEQVDSYDNITAYRAFTTYRGPGEFAVRWLKKGVKDSMKLGKGPEDDISCAVIAITSKEQGNDSN